MQVLVLIDTELGWDNVVGIYANTFENRRKLEDFCDESETCVFKTKFIEQEVNLD